MNQQVVADAVPLHIESTAVSDEPVVMRVLGFSLGAARRQLAALFAACVVGFGVYGVGASRRVSVWVLLAVLVVVGIVTFTAVTRLQRAWRRHRGVSPDSALAMSVTPRRVVLAFDGAPSGAVVVRDRPRDQLVGVSLQPRSFMLIRRRITIIRFHFADGSTDAISIGGGPLDGLRASLRLAGIAPLDPDGTPSPPAEPTVRDAARVTTATGAPRALLCLAFFACGMTSLYLGMLIGHQLDPWAGTGFTEAQADECAWRASELVDPGEAVVAFRQGGTLNRDVDLLVAEADVRSADGTMHTFDFVCASDAGRITATRIN